MKMTRRSFAAGIGALVVGSSIKPFSEAFAQITQLQVYFHGLWAFVTSSSGITALTPSTCDHCYLVGSLAGTLSPFPAGVFSLAGVQAGLGTFLDANNLILPLSSGVLLSDFRNQVVFNQLPATIDSLRTVSATFNFGKRTLPMVQRFTYNVLSGTPSFSNLGLTITGDASGNANIHFYAEPDHKVGSHAFDAQMDLGKKLKFSNWQLQAVDSPPPNPPEDQKTLMERGVTCMPACISPQGPSSSREEGKRADAQAAAKLRKLKALGLDQVEGQPGPDVANCMSVVLYG